MSASAAGYAVNTYAWTLTHPAQACLEGLAGRGHRVFEVMMMEALERHGDPRLGVVYDIANGVFAREDLAHGLHRVRGRLKLVHLSDTPLATYRHAPVGEGVVPFAAVPPVLEQIGYEGPPMLEIICDQPDTEFPASIEALEAMGWGRIARR